MPAQLNAARDLFLHAVGKLPPEQWDAYVAGACGGDAELKHQVELLLRVHREAGSFLDRPAAAMGRTGAFAPEPAAATIAPGTVIGPYKLLQQIGEGGMGTVFMAEQAEPVRRTVAVKVIKAGMDSRQVVARFEAERQALAMMDHVNIARVLDAGATDAGLPYFVMELVHGVPITKYCDDNHLTPRERLGLFVPVCQAVQHAHQKGIIHRDVKPSNVMVTLYDGKPVPKVIDFGVAKATEQKLTERTLFTQYGTMVGTFEYMSPEQAEMSALGVDTRSDIYSLGVLLYELLTGSTPLTRKRLKEAAYAEILRMIREEEPPRPSTRLSDSGEALASISANRQTEPARLTKLVRGELDWIVMRALEKDRNRRYETANGFAQDVQNYLSDEPVSACPPSRWYRFRKFGRRNRAAMAAGLAGALAVLLTVAGLIANNWLVAREKTKTEVALETALAEKKRADENLARARKAVRDYLSTTANDPRLRAADLQPLRKNLLATAVPFFEEFAALQAGDPEAEGERGQAIFQLAHVREELGETEKARAEYERARDIFAALAAAHPEVPKYRETLAVSRYNLGNVLDELHKPVEAEAEYREALAVVDRLRAENDKPEYRHHLATVYNNQGTLFSGRKEHREAVAAYRRAAAVLEKLVNEAPSHLEHLQTLATTRANLATAHGELGEDAEALALFRQAIAAKTRLVELDRPNREYRNSLAMSQNNLGTLLESRGDPAGAEAAYREARAIWAQLAADFRSVPDYRHSLAQSYYNRGRLLQRQDQPVEAIAAYRQAVGLLEALARDFGRNLLYQEHLALNTNHLGLLLLENRQPAEAESAFRTAVAAHERLTASGAENLANAVDLGGNYVNLGIAVRDGGRAEGSLEWFAKAVATLKPLADRKPPAADARLFLRNAHSNRAGALMALERYREAIPDWDVSHDLSDERDRWTYRLGRLEALARAGEHAGATAAADTAARADEATAGVLYDAACIHALSAVAAGPDKAVAERYAGRAVELLRQAVGKGYQDVGHLKKDPDLDPLRSRADFKKLMAELEAKQKDGTPKR
jgi:serine/threonine protein kinase/tetratricopeptide (TPR) repeat protein